MRDLGDINFCEEVSEGYSTKRILSHFFVRLNPDLQTSNNNSNNNNNNNNNSNNNHKNSNIRFFGKTFKVEKQKSSGGGSA